MLLVRRRGAPFAGYWSLPGGRVEPGERPETAAVREVREETGIAIGRVRRLDTVEIDTAEGGGGAATRFVLEVFQGDYLSGTATAGDDAAEARWVNPSELRDLRLTDQSRAIIERHGEEPADAA